MDRQATKANGRFKFSRENLVLLIMVLPAIIAIFIFNYMPLYGIQLAFRKYSYATGISGGEFVGLDYFKQFITSNQFPVLMRNTFVICITTIIFTFPAPIILALLFNQIKQKKLKKTMQTVTYMPHFISIVVVVSIIRLILSPDTGIIGQHLQSSTGEVINLIGSSNAFLWLYVFSDIWQHCGWNAIIYLAALSSVDTQLYDAAKIDGAGRWKLIRYIDIPTIMPTMVILLILQMGNLLNANFDKIFLMQNSMNLSVSEVISTYVYKIGMESNQFSYAAAIGLFSTIINVFFLLVTNSIAKKAGDMSLW